MLISLFKKHQKAEQTENIEAAVLTKERGK